jgi:hypothetical protein
MIIESLNYYEFDVWIMRKYHYQVFQNLINEILILWYLMQKYHWWDYSNDWSIIFSKIKIIDIWITHNKYRSDADLILKWKHF